MGCLPESVLETTPWIVLFHSFLRMQLQDGCSAFAYAYGDDRLLQVAAESIMSLEERATTACESIMRWGEHNRLKLCVGKTKIMLLKGRLVGRPPVVNMGNERIEYVHSRKYLDVILDEKLTIGRV